MTNQIQCNPIQRNKPVCYCFPAEPQEHNAQCMNTLWFCCLRHNHDNSYVTTKNTPNMTPIKVTSNKCSCFFPIIRKIVDSKFIGNIFDIKNTSPYRSDHAISKQAYSSEWASMRNERVPAAELCLYLFLITSAILFICKWNCDIIQSCLSSEYPLYLDDSWEHWIQLAGVSIYDAREVVVFNCN